MPKKITTPTKAERLAVNNDAADRLGQLFTAIYNGNWKPKGNGTYGARPTARELKAYRLTKENML